ncbi:hypothetical protein chiPu_0004316 [Chiloscyllium punctatum]|uniref:Uncharacterized protein n=1 Tax=Chiloscyllium punctatum TaxID=137246 RepID=A0A401S686_CHIPU|nr:hypothetical protein [Chiloscyllium punctatum]
MKITSCSIGKSKSASEKSSEDEMLLHSDRCDYFVCHHYHHRGFGEALNLAQYTCRIFQFYPLFFSNSPQKRINQME